MTAATPVPVKIDFVSDVVCPWCVIGLRSLAVPVRSRHNAVVAAINTGIHSARVSEAEMIDKMLPILHESAAIVGRQLS